MELGLSRIGLTRTGQSGKNKIGPSWTCLSRLRPTELHLPQPRQPDGPDSQLWMTTFHLSATCASRTTPSLLGAPSWEVPSQCIAHQCGVDSQLTPSRRGEGHPPTSKRRLSVANTGGQVLQPPCKCELQHFRLRIPFCPALRTLQKQHSGGQTNRLDDNTNNDARRAP